MRRKIFTAVMILLITPSMLLAARPSINELNTRVNQLEAENNTQQSEIDALRNDVDEIQAALAQQCAILTDPAPVFCVKRVFLSSDSRFGGDFANPSGIDEADAICQRDGSALGGTWMAWISEGSINPATRFFKAGKYVDLQGVTIANGWADLVDGNIDAPINVMADGIRDTDPDTTVWTGTGGGGTTGLNCENWTTQDSNFVYYGNASSTDITWTLDSNAELEQCRALRFFYCFEQ